jgi:hypothetical protein
LSLLLTVKCKRRGALKELSSELEDLRAREGGQREGMRMCSGGNA